MTRTFGAHVALAPFDLSIGPGEITGLLGPNGSGKSTFMRCLIGLVRPDAGDADVDGATLKGDGTAIRERVCYAPGEISLYGEMRARDQLAWLLRGRARGALERAQAIAARLELPLERRVRGFSHGMKRQLMLAAAFAPNVRVRILDEPTEGLDPTKRGLVIDLLREDVRAGTTILLSSHHLGEIDRVCDRLLFLAGGRLIADESAADLARRAARHVRITCGPDGDVEAWRRALERLPARLVRVDTQDDGARRATFTLASDDPREFLAALASSRELPPPRAIAHGSLSLAELYRELYGVEAC